MRSAARTAVSVLVLLLCADPVAGQARDSTGFADYLFRQGEYYRAVTEYLRLSYDATDPAVRAMLLVDIGRCYYRGGEYEECIRFCERSAGELSPRPAAFAEAQLLRGKCYYQLGRYASAIEFLEQHPLEDSLLRNDHALLLGMAYARTAAWESAEAAWRRIGDDSEWHRVSSTLQANIARGGDLPERSPTLAGMFSGIIPGTGYMYAERPGTGIAALVINGLLIWAAGDAVRSEQYGIAAVTGFLGLGWYVGNIIGSVSAARQYNERERSAFINSLLQSQGLDEYVPKHPTAGE
jgi:tetratricopeptide (TPR) repeat protein